MLTSHASVSHIMVSYGHDVVIHTLLKSAEALNSLFKLEHLESFSYLFLYFLR